VCLASVLGCSCPKEPINYINSVLSQKKFKNFTILLPPNDYVDRSIGKYFAEEERIECPYNIQYNLSGCDVDPAEYYLQTFLLKEL
jgi:hypothetical protein